MSGAETFVAPTMADLEQDLRHWIVEQTADRIGNLEVEVLADRIQIRCRATSIDFQEASLGILDAIRLLRGRASREIDVRITVVRHASITSCGCRLESGIGGS